MFGCSSFPCPSRTVALTRTGIVCVSRAFHANRSILTNHQVSVKDRLTFLHAVVTPVACFAAGHRKIFKQELAALDVAHRKLLRRVVGPPAGMDWSRPWHEILHD